VREGAVSWLAGFPQAELDVSFFPADWDDDGGERCCEDHYGAVLVGLSVSSMVCGRIYTP